MTVKITAFEGCQTFLLDCQDNFDFRNLSSQVVEFFLKISGRSADKIVTIVQKKENFLIFNAQLVDNPMMIIKFCHLVKFKPKNYRIFNLVKIQEKEVFKQPSLHQIGRCLHSERSYSNSRFPIYEDHLMFSIADLVDKIIQLLLSPVYIWRLFMAL